MTPRVDNTQHIADTIAILQGKESLHSLGMDKSTFAHVYDTAQIMVINYYIAVKVRNHYVAIQHTPTWKRRVR